MDELSDSVVSGRFNAGSSAVCCAAAGVPDGLAGREGDGRDFRDLVFECGRVEVQAHVLYVVFGGGAALVELVGVVELILAGGVGEVWHRV